MQQKEFVQQVVSKYSTDLIQGYKAVYNPGENITILVEQGNYISDIANIQLLFRPVYTGAGVSAVQASDLLTLNSLTLNQVELMAHSEHEGRGICMNFLKSLTPANVVDVPETPGNDLQYESYGIRRGIDSQAVDKLHIYKNVLGSADNLFTSSAGPYIRNMHRRAKHAQKYFTYTQDDNGFITSAVDAAPLYNYETVKLSDIAPELLQLGRISMINKKIRIDLQLVQAGLVLTSARNGNGGTSASIGAATYSITDACVYSRMFQIKPSMVVAVNEMSMSPISQITYVQQSQAFDGSVLNLTTSLQHKHVLAALVFFQKSSRLGTDTSTGIVNYTQNTVIDNGMVHYFHDSYKIDTNSIYVELGGKRFKQSDIPIANKQNAAFINAQNSLQEVFNGRQMANPLCDFVHNKYVHVIPISPEAYDDDFTSGFTQANLHIEVNDAVRTNTYLPGYKATVVYLCMQTIIPTQEGVRLER